MTSKIAIGLILLVGFIPMVIEHTDWQRYVCGKSKYDIPVLAYLLHTMGELSLSPVGFRS